MRPPAHVDTRFRRSGCNSAAGQATWTTRQPGGRCRACITHARAPCCRSVPVGVVQPQARKPSDRHAAATRGAARGRRTPPVPGRPPRTRAAGRRRHGRGAGLDEPPTRRPPSPRRKPSRAAIARARAARRAQRAAVVKRWSRRLGVVGLSTLLLPAAVALVLPGSGSGNDNSGDITTLALTAQSTLLHGADHYRQLEQVVAQRRSELQRARAAERAARATVDAAQRAVGTSSADLYRAGADARFPLLMLDAHDPSSAGDALTRQTLADRTDAELDSAVTRAQRSTTVLATAAERVTRAESAVAAAAERADAVLAESRETVAQLSPAVAVRLAALTTVSPTAAEKQRNASATRRWQQYLARLAAADITPPPAAALHGDQLPAGLSPALDAAHKPIPGIAWAVIGNRPITVLPAETVAAVSNALSQLGKPYAAVPAGRTPTTAVASPPPAGCSPATPSPRRRRRSGRPVRPCPRQICRSGTWSFRPAAATSASTSATATSWARRRPATASASSHCRPARPRSG